MSVDQCTPEIEYIFRNLPLVLCMLHAKRFCHITHSIAVQALQSKGVHDIAAELATRNLLLAG